MTGHLLCPMCSGRGVLLLGEKEGVDIFRCSLCALIYRTPLLHIFYDGTYTDARYHVDARIPLAQGGQGTTLERYGHDLDVARQRLADLLKFASPPTSLLDFGCSGGAMVDVATEAGFDAYGTEPGEWIINQVAKARPKTARKMLVASSTAELACCMDVITAYDVIEHLVDPTLELDSMRLRLAVGGILLIEQPDPSSEQAVTSGIDWRHIKPREHLYLMSPANFDRILVDTMFFRKVAQWAPLPGRITMVYQKELRKMDKDQKPREPFFTGLSDMPRTEQEFGAGKTEVTVSVPDAPKNG